MSIRKKTVLDQFDWIRAVACLGIVLYHFSVESGWMKFFDSFGGGVSYGDIYVTVFFFISGALLAYNHREVSDLKTFYQKRALSIFPPFYLGWGLMYLRDVIRYKNLFYRGNPFSILLSLIGMDGYLAYKVNDYYILGEWFIGAIILLYLLYPLLSYLNRRCRAVLFGSVLLLYLVSFPVNFSGMPGFRTLPSCLFSFTVGMLFVDFQDTAVSYWWAAAAGLLALRLVPYGNVNLKGHLAGFFMAYFLYGIGTFLMKHHRVKKVMQWISGLSYYVFLTHHLAICLLLKAAPSDAPLVFQLLLLAVTLCAVFVSALVLRWLSQKLFFPHRTKQ